MTLLNLQLEYILKPFDYSLTDISNLYAIGVVAGLLGDLLMGYSVKRLQSYKLCLKISNIITTVGFLCLIMSLAADYHPLFYIFYFMTCMFSSILALTFEFACELSFPVGEITTISWLGVIGNLMNAVQLAFELGVLRTVNKSLSFIVLSFMCFVIFLANFLIAKINEVQRRTEAD